ncbi:hypothetical protein CANINC_001915 [Pichia inconspicua]|uniref:Extracellular mutant protein 11 C-terminal domain-containing protein n=1 Tax=Pichia inconspicua TaxID=52247 RepID=A0A4V4NFV0_9ASCO|nr:hypothetical protein CANINC_001915 [[Candida] inconspicua]
MNTIKVKLEPGTDKDNYNNSTTQSCSPQKPKEIGKSRPSSSISQIPRLKTVEKTEIKVKLENPVVNVLSKKKNNKTLENSTLMDYMLEVPELNFNEEALPDNESDCSKFSSPFDSRVDTAGTNLTYMTKNTTRNEKDPLIKIEEKTTHMEKQSQLRQSSDLLNDCNSFGSSPCIDQKIKLNKKKEQDLLDENKLLKKKKLKPSNLGNNQRKENVSFDSVDATDGDSELRSQNYGVFDEQRPCTPPNYRIDTKPVYEYMEGEDAIYFDIMGKKDPTEKLDENEKQFFDYVHMNFEQWVEQSERFNHEYKTLMEQVIVARIKFDKRFQYLRENLDEFAINLEKFGSDINKRSEILKEYCNKIVNEIE